MDTVGSHERVAIVVVALLWILSGVLALAETAFTRVNRIRLLALEEEGDKRARRVLRLLEHPEQTLNSILLLVLGCQMIGATILGTVLEPSLGAAGIAIGIFVEIFVVFTLFEVVPKTFALQHSDRTALAISPLLVVGHGLPAAAVAHAPVHRFRQHRPAGQGHALGSVHHRGRHPHDGRRRRAGRLDRDRGARAHPLDLRVRRHGRA